MPVHSFECPECGEEFDIITTDVEKERECSNCEYVGKMIWRPWMNHNANQGKSDPKSPMYWKKGKSAEQISRVLTDEAKPY